jgi:hypothetical protein
VSARWCNSLRERTGADELSLQAAASGASVIWRTGDQEGAYYGIGVHATLTGVAAVATVEYGDG